MLKEFINKDVEITVALGSFLGGGGSTPAFYKGTLLDVTDEFCKIRLLKSKTPNADVLISRKYIIVVKEL